MKEGVNELVIWNNSPPDSRKNKYLVVAYDNSGSTSNSSSLVQGKWSDKDLHGDREDAPQGEWMVRLKLNRLDRDQQKTVDALRPARYRKAVDEKKEFVWGFTDAAHWVFPDRPYTEPLENTWTMDAARNEYESCQFVMVPVSMEIRMAEVFADDLQLEDGAVISRDAIVVRLVRTARCLLHFPSIFHGVSYRLTGSPYTFPPLRLPAPTNLS